MIDFQTNGDCGAIIGTEFYQNAVQELAVKLSTEKAFQILDEFRKIYQLSSSNLELSIVSAVLAVIYQNNSMDVLQAEIAELRTEIKELKQKTYSVENPSILNPSTLNRLIESSEEINSMDIRITDNDKESGIDSYYENMAHDYDAQFEYEEEIPSFADSVTDIKSVQEEAIGVNPNISIDTGWSNPISYGSAPLNGSHLTMSPTFVALLSITSVR